MSAELRMIFLRSKPVTMRNKVSPIVAPLVEDSLALIQFHDPISLRKTGLRDRVHWLRVA